MTALTVLAVGATGSIGRRVVTETAAAGHRVRAIVRSRERAALLPAGTDVVIGDGGVRIALMTAVGVTDRTGHYNQTTEAHDWKRRSERLVRASGHPYTIVRPGWFDYNSPDQQQVVMLQGDTRHTGTPADGVIARRQIAQVLVGSLTSPAAASKTLELVADVGPATADLEPLFGDLAPDLVGSLDGVADADNMPVDAEPASVQAEISAALR
jgi:uncharacterized protein YbjT (DUF2867 family)